MYSLTRYTVVADTMSSPVKRLNVIQCVSTDNIFKLGLEHVVC